MSSTRLFARQMSSCDFNISQVRAYSKNIYYFLRSTETFNRTGSNWLALKNQHCRRKISSTRLFARQMSSCDFNISQVRAYSKNIYYFLRSTETFNRTGSNWLALKNQHCRRKISSTRLFARQMSSCDFSISQVHRRIFPKVYRNFQ